MCVVSHITYAFVRVGEACPTMLTSIQTRYMQLAPVRSSCGDTLTWQRTGAKMYRDEHGVWVVTRRKSTTIRKKKVGGNASVVVVIVENAFDTYSLYAGRSSPDTKDTHTPLL
jgi:hypothetical protein